MSNIRVHVTCLAGTELAIAIKEARSLSRKLETIVVLRFNGIDVNVDEDSKIADVQRSYDEELEHKGGRRQ